MTSLRTWAKRLSTRRAQKREAELRAGQVMAGRGGVRAVTPSVVPTPIAGHSLVFAHDQVTLWAQAKRRKQGRAKTVEIYQRLMAERGWPSAEPPA